MRLKYIVGLMVIAFIMGSMGTATTECPYAFSGAMAVYSYTWGSNNSHGMVTFKILDVGGNKMRVQIIDTGMEFGNGTYVDNVSDPYYFPAVSTAELGNGTLDFGSQFLFLYNIVVLQTPYGNRTAYQYSLGHINFYFDKKTGILLEESSAGAELSSMHLVKTNIIQGENTITWITLLSIGIAGTAGAIVLLWLLVLRKR